MERIRVQVNLEAAMNFALLTIIVLFLIRTIFIVWNAVRNGFVQLAFRTWGSFDQAISASNHRVDDNTDHSVVIRHFRQPTGTIALTLDGQTTDSKALVEPLNARGNIFAGKFFYIRIYKIIPSTPRAVIFNSIFSIISSPTPKTSF